MSEWKMISEGKVRKVYENAEGTQVLLVAGDGVSAFDRKLGVKIAGKGEMLTRISKYWFDRTRTIAPNAYSMIKQSPKDAMECATIGIDPERATRMLKLEMLPVEAIVRGYITGSIWSAYEKGNREFCGITLPDGLKNSERLASPIFTPTTKAPEGEHDQNLSFDEMVNHLRMHGVINASECARLVKDYALSLYYYASNQLMKKGIILADTKFEFGMHPLTGKVILGDELFTPDSSRFWLLKDYTVGKSQKSMDKQIIRDWVKEHPGKQVPRAVLEKTAIIYAKITDVITDIANARRLI